MVTHAQVSRWVQFQCELSHGGTHLECRQRVFGDLEYVQQIAFLTCREVMLILNNISNVSPLVLGIEDLSFIQLEPVLANSSSSCWMK